MEGLGVPAPTLNNQIGEQAEDGDPLQRPCYVSILVIQSGNENRCAAMRVGIAISQTFAKEMKKHTVIVMLAGLLVFCGTFAGWLISIRNAQKEWPHTQLQNAVTLGAALGEHRDRHGSYPARLKDLVDGGTMNQQEFKALQFRAEPKADPEQWLYRAPEQLFDIAIVAPKEIHPWSGHSGYTATARADGGGELILEAKRSRIPAWASK